MSIQVEEVCKKIAESCAGVREGELVTILGGAHNLEFCESLALACYRLGAVPVLSVTSDEYEHKRLTLLSTDDLARTPRHLMEMIKESDVVIWLSPFEDPSLFKDVDPTKLQASQEPLDALEAEMRKRRYIQMIYPSKPDLLEAGLTKEEGLRIYLQAFDADYEWMKRRALDLVNLLRDKQEIRVLTDAGTDLRFRIRGRRIGVNYGPIDEEARALGETEIQLPAGEAYVAPLEDSAEGELVVCWVHTLWGVVKGLKLRFSGGRVVSYSAEEGEEHLKKMFSQVEGDWDAIAEFALGLNPEIRPCGIWFLDEEALGTTHIAIGENRHLGGENSSTLHKDFILERPMVYADGQMTLEKGEITDQQ